MRTSAKWALAISIVLLVLGVVLAGAGLFVNMDKVIIKSETTAGFSYQYTQRISGNADKALCFIVPGMMSFIAGLATMGYFIYLANTPNVKKNERSSFSSSERKSDKKEEPEVKKPSVLVEKPYEPEDVPENVENSSSENTEE